MVCLLFLFFPLHPAARGDGLRPSLHSPLLKSHRTSKWMVLVSRCSSSAHACAPAAEGSPLVGGGVRLAPCPRPAVEGSPTRALPVAGTGLRPARSMRAPGGEGSPARALPATSVEEAPLAPSSSPAMEKDDDSRRELRSRRSIRAARAPTEELRLRPGRLSHGRQTTDTFACAPRGTAEPRDRPRRQRRSRPRRRSPHGGPAALVPRTEPDEPPRGTAEVAPAAPTLAPSAVPPLARARLLR